MFDYGALELMPLTGTLKVRPEERSSSFRHEAERARPSLYEVHLDDYDIQVRMAATKASAVFDFVYPACDSAYVVVDAMPSLFTAGAPAEISISPQRREISGKSAMTARAYRETGFSLSASTRSSKTSGLSTKTWITPKSSKTGISSQKRMANS